MLNKFLEYLKDKLGDNAVGIILTLVAGASILYFFTNFFVTSELYSHEKAEMSAAKDSMEKNLLVQVKQGDIRNTIEISEIKLSAARVEKMKLENFIDIKQGGDCTERQEIRLNELTKIIADLSLRKEMLYKEALEKR